MNESDGEEKEDDKLSEVNGDSCLIINEDCSRYYSSTSEDGNDDNEDDGQDKSLPLNIPSKEEIIIEKEESYPYSCEISSSGDEFGYRSYSDSETDARYSYEDDDNAYETDDENDSSSSSSSSSSYSSSSSFSSLK